MGIQQGNGTVKDLGSKRHLKGKPWATKHCRFNCDQNKEKRTQTSKDEYKKRTVLLGQRYECPSQPRC